MVLLSPPAAIYPVKALFLIALICGHGRWEDLIAPRPGQLLQMEVPPGMTPLRSGVMEMSYAKVRPSPRAPAPAAAAAAAGIGVPWHSIRLRS